MFVYQEDAAACGHDQPATRIVRSKKRSPLYDGATKFTIAQIATRRVGESQPIHGVWWWFVVDLYQSRVGDPSDRNH